MNQKKMDLIQSGMKLFAQQGYHKTSIQEIATEAGISKGAFYLYFDSKEQFIGTALQYFHNQLKKQIAEATMEDLPPKQSLSQQILFITTYIYEHRNFIIMHLREDISIGDHVEHFFQQMKIDNYHWLKENVQEIYSDQVEPYLFDIIIQLEGLISSFLKWLVIDQLPLDKNRIGPYIVKRLDDIVQGILERDEKPLIQMDHLPTHYQSMINKKNVEEELEKTLITLKNKVTQLNIQQKEKERLLKVVDIVLQKVMKKERQNIMIQGLLAHFTNVPELKNECEKIAGILQIELL